MQATATATTHTFPWVKWMAEISEKTKIGLQIGTAAALLIAAVMVGKYWGGWEKERTYTLETLTKHDGRISKLETAMIELKDLVRDGQRTQDAAAKDSATAAANTTGIVYDLGELKVKLAERGISWSRRGESP